MLQGHIDTLDRHGLRGWAQDPADPDTPVSLAILIDGEPFTRVLANVFRQDVLDAGFSAGRCGFALRLEGLSPLRHHTVDIVAEGSGWPIPGTPRIIPAAPEPDDATLDELAALLGQVEGAGALTRWAGFLAGQAVQLLQRRADAAANKPHPSAPRHFRVRWTGQGPDPDPEPAPRALVIDETLPSLTRDAGSRALVSHMESLRRLGFRVVLAPADMKGGDTAALEAAGIECCCSPWSASVEEVLRRENGGFALLYVHRATSARYFSLLRHHQPRARLVYSVADLHHLRLARQAEVEGRPELLEASERARVVERAAMRFADAVITHSTFERDLIERDVPPGRVHVVPWAVQPQPPPALAGVAFIGSFGHPPNVDAAWWLIQDVMPLVRAVDPSIHCVVAGSGMPDALRAIVAPGIRPVGFAPDLHALLAPVRLTVAPLTFGAGLKGKVLDSLAAGIPCACTSIAAEGMDWPPVLQAMVGDGAEALAAVILRLHGDPALNAACGEAGRAFVEAAMSEARVDAAMRKAAGLP